VIDPLAGRFGGLLPSVATRGGLYAVVLRLPGVLMINTSQSLTTSTLDVESWTWAERRALGEKIRRLMVQRVQKKTKP
jgi:hypothetical protein